MTAFFCHLSLPSCHSSCSWFVCYFDVLYSEIWNINLTTFISYLQLWSNTTSSLILAHYWHLTFFLVISVFHLTLHMWNFKADWTKCYEYFIGVFFAVAKGSVWHINIFSFPVSDINHSLCLLTYWIVNCYIKKKKIKYFNELTIVFFTKVWHDIAFYFWTAFDSGTKNAHHFMTRTTIKQQCEGPCRLHMAFLYFIYRVILNGAELWFLKLLLSFCEIHALFLKNCPHRDFGPDTEWADFIVKLFKTVLTHPKKLLNGKFNMKG